MDDRLRKEIIEAATQNDISRVDFSEIFSETTLKPKRNLLASGFGTLLIAALDLQVNGFLNLSPKDVAILDHSVTIGLSGIVVVYFSCTFLIGSFVDYLSWRFERERYMVKPYLDLAVLIEKELRDAGMHLEQAEKYLGSIEAQEADYPKGGNEFLEKRTQYLADAWNELKTAANELRGLRQSFEPPLASWAKTIQKAKALDWRRKTRILGLWIFDILVPIAVAMLAIHKSAAYLISTAVLVAF